MQPETSRSEKARQFLQWIGDSGDESASRSLAELAGLAAAYAEQAFERIGGDERQKALACRRGCDWCCYLPVESNLAEATRALKLASHKLDEQAFASLTRRILEAAAAYPPPPAQPLSRNPPCPFLLDGACQVYEVRPLACRGWNSFDAGACETAWREGIQATKVPLDRRLQAVHANASEALNRALVRDRLGAPLALVPALAAALDDLSR